MATFQQNQESNKELTTILNSIAVTLTLEPRITNQDGYEQVIRSNMLDVKHTNNLFNQKVK